MTPEKKDEESTMCSLNRLRPRMKRLVLHLVAIAIVSFTVGFGIIALSGGIPSQGENPFIGLNDSVFMTPDVTTIPQENAQSANISINQGMGHLDIKGGSGALLESRVYAKDPGGKPVFGSAIAGSEKIVTMKEKTGENLQQMFPKRWDVMITDKVPVALTVHIGTGDSTLALGTMNITSLDVSSGVGNTRISVDKYQGSDFNAKIVQNVGDLTIRVPKDRNVRISVLKSVGDITSDGLKSENGSYVTNGMPGIEISITQGVGKVTLEAV
jgi:hypothetical protein